LWAAFHLVSGFHSLSGRKLISWQLFLTILTSAVLFAVFDLLTACSALAGGMISVIANAFFALRLFSDQGSWQPDSLAAVVYRGIIGRIVLTITLFFMVVVLLKPLNIIAFFSVYLWIQVSPALIAGVQNRV
jgi:F0F1-type ATP synthase assembly protein I